MSIILIGVGNEYRSDDGVGLFVAKEIRRKQVPDLTVKEESGEGAALMETWQGFDNVIIVDAVSSGAEPGTVFKINAAADRVPSKFFHYSTHAFSVAEAIELARTMNKLPSNLLIYGIEGENFFFGKSISSAVKNAAGDVYEQIVRYIIEINRLN